jgi:hypothetical protein
MGWPGVDTSDISCEDILAGVAGVLEHFVSAAADAAVTSGKCPAPTAFDAHEILPIRSYLCELRPPCHIPFLPPTHPITHPPSGTLQARAYARGLLSVTYMGSPLRAFASPRACVHVPCCARSCVVCTSADAALLYPLRRSPRSRRPLQQGVLRHRACVRRTDPSEPSRLCYLGAQRAPPHPRQVSLPRFSACWQHGLCCVRARTCVRVVCVCVWCVRVCLCLWCVCVCVRARTCVCVCVCVASSVRLS